MAASLIDKFMSATSRDGLRPANIARDLYQIAELVELCFSTQLDSSGRAAIREMKALGRLGPFLLPLILLDRTGYGVSMGYVWRDKRRVVGNASIFRAGQHPHLGRGWLVANVAVHPDYRRRGIARALMHATIDLARRYRGRWIVLQVETDNAGAQQLYRDLGFTPYENLTQWETSRLHFKSDTNHQQAWPVRERQPHEISQEMKLIYERARIGAMTWTRPLESSMIRGSLLSAYSGSLDSSARREYWVLPDPLNHDTLAGSLWVQYSGWRRVQLSLFLDPALDVPAARQALLRHILQRQGLQNRPVRIETTADDKPVETLLQNLGFIPKRHLTQMRLIL